MIINKHILIIGSMKGGTTTLFNQLLEHPCIIKPKFKEHYFFWENKFGDWNEYANNLNANNGDYTIDASPFYAINRKEILGARIIKNLKIIYMLRHPIFRIESHYNHNRLRLRENETMYNAVKKDNYRYIDNSMYYDNLEFFCNNFEAENILAVRSEDLFCDINSTMKSVYDFLKLKFIKHKNKKFSLNEKLRQKENYKYIRIDTSTYNSLEKRLDKNRKLLYNRYRVKW